MTILIWAVIVVGLLGVVGILVGAPYLPTKKKQVQTALDLLDLKKGQTVLDLGSGDGVFMKAAAKRGLVVIGYEVSPIWWLVSIIRTWPVRHRVTVYLKNYWKEPLPEDTAGVYVFLLRKYMPALNSKLKAETQQPIRLASFAFKIPGKKPVAEQDGIALYEYKPTTDKKA